jgi:methylglutamate dehydrogenase subunit C
MNRGSNRLPAGGRIDRSRPLQFTLDGRTLSGFAGDTLASALLANGIVRVGRSFKYHRPRGFLAAGVEEPNGLFTLGEGGRTTPNMAGTVVELTDGLSAACQNAWPSVDFDLRAINSWFAPFLGAGFYYKTFMGPRRGSWMLYEPFIRRAAGLGKGVHQRDPDRYESRNAYADVLVIGAGPAGLAAACAAAQGGARVTLVDQDSLPGGALLSRRIDDALEPWRVQMLATLERLPRVELLTRTTALGLYDGNTVALLERRDHRSPRPERGEVREIVITLRARAIVFATGALERPLVFADNDRPGVMLASAARSYLNRHAVRCGERALVATNNDSAWAAALDLAAAGSRVTVVDQRSEVDGTLHDQALRAGITVRTGAHVARALGARRVAGAVVVDGDGAGAQRLECDLLCMSGGWAPTVHLTSHTGIRPVYDASLDAFVPGGYAPGHFGAGALAGLATTDEAIASGARAGVAAARHTGHRSWTCASPLARAWPTACTAWCKR